MKNKGRKHLAGINSKSGAGNCKSMLVSLTRPITQISPNHDFNLKGYSKRFIKSKWAKRVRGYFKSQTKELLDENIIGY